MKISKYLFIFILLLVIGSCVGSAADYYVSTTGNDSADGLTIDTAWATPSYAATQAVAGDTILMVNGTWENDHVIFSNNGTNENYITLKAYNGTPILNGTDWLGKGILLSNSEYIKIRGLTITGFDNNMEISYANNIIIDSCNIYGSGDNESESNSKGTMHGHVLGVLHGSTNITVNNNKFHDIQNGRNLIDLVGGDTAITSYITFSNNELYDVGYHTALNILNNYNNVAHAYDDSVQYISIIGNTFHNITTLNSYAIATNSASIYHSNISNNYVYSAVRGISVAAVNTTFINNTVLDTSEAVALGCHQSAATGRIYNSTFISNNAPISFFGGAPDTVVINPLYLVTSATSTYVGLQDITNELGLGAKYEGKFEINQTSNTIYDVVKTGGIGVYIISETMYYTTHANSTINLTDDPYTTFDVSVHNITLVPSENYVTVTNTTTNITVDYHSQSISKLDFMIGDDVSNKYINTINVTEESSLYYSNETLIQTLSGTEQYFTESLSSGEYYITVVANDTAEIETFATAASAFTLIVFTTAAASSRRFRRGVGGFVNRRLRRR